MPQNSAVSSIESNSEKPKTEMHINLKIENNGLYLEVNACIWVYELGRLCVFFRAKLDLEKNMMWIIGIERIFPKKIFNNWLLDM